jgi:hypothetical protein
MKNSTSDIFREVGEKVFLGKIANNNLQERHTKVFGWKGAP